MDQLLRQSWWIIALRGVVAVLFGVVALMWLAFALLWIVAMFVAVVPGGRQLDPARVRLQRRCKRHRMGAHELTRRFAVAWYALACSRTVVAERLPYIRSCAAFAAADGYGIRTYMTHALRCWKGCYMNNIRIGAAGQESTCTENAARASAARVSPMTLGCGPHRSGVEAYLLGCRYSPRVCVCCRQFTHPRNCARL